MTRSWTMIYVLRPRLDTLLLSASDRARIHHHFVAQFNRYQQTWKAEVGLNLVPPAGSPWIPPWSYRVGARTPKPSRTMLELLPVEGTSLVVMWIPLHFFASTFLAAWVYASGWARGLVDGYVAHSPWRVTPGTHQAPERGVHKN